VPAQPARRHSRPPFANTSAEAAIQPPDSQRLPARIATSAARRPGAARCFQLKPAPDAASAISHAVTPCPAATMPRCPGYWVVPPIRRHDRSIITRPCQPAGSVLRWAKAGEARLDSGASYASLPAVRWPATVRHRRQSISRRYARAFEVAAAMLFWRYRQCQFASVKARAPGVEALSARHSALMFSLAGSALLLARFSPAALLLMPCQQLRHAMLRCQATRLPAAKASGLLFIPCHY